MPTIKTSEKFLKNLAKCDKKRGWKSEDVWKIIDILRSRPFTQAEMLKYHDHALINNFKGYREFHPYGRHHNWVVLYHAEGSSIVLDDSTISFDNTGTHEEVLGYSENELVFI